MLCIKHFESYQLLQNIMPVILKILFHRWLARQICHSEYNLSFSEYNISENGTLSLKEKQGERNHRMTLMHLKSDASKPQML